MSRIIIFFLILGGLSLQQTVAHQLAFPTAEGYGKYTTGGRGGDVYEVTNLNDSGEGSLRSAVEAEGPRTVEFRVSGTIELESDLSIENPFITIVGQTAPGDGITIKNYPLSVDSYEVIIRYLRLRQGDEVRNRYISDVWVADNGDGTYTNPILHADYSDPDVVRVGDGYYMISFSFNTVPGLPILHSKDLVNWELINHALPALTDLGLTLLSRKQIIKNIK